MYRKMSCGFQSATVSSYMTVEEKLEEQGAGWFSFESTPKKKKKGWGGSLRLPVLEFLYRECFFL